MEMEFTDGVPVVMVGTSSIRPHSTRQLPMIGEARACSAAIESGDSQRTKDERVYRH